jgi:hypothetical protein
LQHSLPSYAAPGATARCSAAVNKGDFPVDLRDHSRFEQVVIPIDALTHYCALVSMLRCKGEWTENADR